MPYPAQPARGPGRPPPEVEELAEKLKDVRNRRAEELGLDRGTLLPNATLTAIAVAGARGPRRRWRRVEGMRRWQVEAVGAEMLDVLRRG